MSYPRRQQYRRLGRALTAAAGALVAVLLAVVFASGGALLVALLLVSTAVVPGLRAHRWLRLAARSSIGAHSEAEVRRALAGLEAECWKVCHSLRWAARGDIDSLAIAPGGAAFAIEVKTAGYESRHLSLVREQAAWLWRFRRRWCRHGAVPVLCVVRRRGVQRWDDGVLIVSIDRLVPALRAMSYPIERVALPF